MWTQHRAGLPVAIELGAEFLHGETAEIDPIVQRESLRSVDITGRRFTRERGRLRVLDDFWERIDRVFGELADARKRDRSFAEALTHIPAIHAADRKLAVQYVEGFHAADTRVISAFSWAR